MPGYRLSSAIACGALGVAMACSSFGSEPGATNQSADGGPADGGVDPFEAGTVLPDGAVVNKPGPSAAQADGLYLACPPTSTRSTFANLSPQPIVAAASGFDYPFGITTDSESVYWVSQFVDKTATSGQQTEAYNGHLKARIHRASKGKPTTDAASTVLVDKENEGVVSLALDGDYVYWAAPKTSGSSTLSIRRVTRDCAKPCPVETISDISSSQPIVLMKRARPGLIFALAGDGKVFSVEPDAKSAKQVHAGAGDLPSFTVAASAVFVAGAFNPTVLSVTKDASHEHATFPEIDPSEKGPEGLATDCTRLYAYRKPDRSLWAADATNVSVFTKLADIGRTGVYDVVADNDYVYVGLLNGGGIFVVDSTTGALVRHYDGSYFRLWADDTGVYAGDHDPKTPGAIYRFSD